MGFRAIAIEGLVLFLTGLNSFVYLGVYGLDVPIFSLGLLSGFVSGVAMGLTFARGLEKKGEIRVSYQTLRFILLIFAGIVSIFLGVLLILDLEAKIRLLSFVYPAVSFLLLGQIAVFLRWELKHKVHIMFGYGAFGLLRRIYTTS